MNNNSMEALGIDLLATAKKIAAEDRVKAKALFGMTDDELDLLIGAPTSRLLEISSSNILLFKPRNHKMFEKALRGDDDWRGFSSQVASMDASK